MKKYRFGLDAWGLALTALLLLPYLVYWCVPALPAIGFQTPLGISAAVFAAAGVVLLLAVKEREEKKFSFSYPLVFFAGIFVLLYYIAWIFSFCGYGNLADVLFLAVCPSAALILYEIFRRNYFALGPTAVFAVLYLLSMVLPWIR